jgi:hypothetical protein
MRAVNRLAVSILVVIGCVVVFPSHALPGWEIEVRHKIEVKPASGEGETFVIKTFVIRRVFQGNHFKEEAFEENGKSTATIIIDLAAERMTVVRHGRREYSTATFQERIADERARRAEAEERLNRLPAADRAKMDQALKELRKTERAEICQHRWEVTRTDQRETIAGYSAIRHDMLLNGHPFAQIWLTKDLGPLQEMDRAMRDRLGALAHNTLLSIGQPPFEGCQAGEPGAEADPSWKLPVDLLLAGLDEGYVMRYQGPIGTTEVVRVQQKELPASEFLPPRGFTRKPLRDF